MDLSFKKAQFLPYLVYFFYDSLCVRNIFFVLLTLFSFEIWLMLGYFSVNNQPILQKPSIRTRMPCSSISNYASFAKLDDDYGMHDAYVQKLKNIPELEQLNNLVMRRNVFIGWFLMNSIHAIFQLARLHRISWPSSTDTRVICFLPVMIVQRFLIAKSFMWCCMIREGERVLRSRESLVDCKWPSINSR